jgi:hypothetical protein
MTPADQFWMKGGPVLDEGAFSIEEALEQGVLTIGAAARTQMILVAKGVKPDNLKFVQVDLGQNLAQLRAKLEADKVMTSTDTFAGSDGVAVSPREEGGRLVKDAAGANKLLTIISQGWI